MQSLTAKAALCIATAMIPFAVDAAADEKTDCADAHASGQRLQRDGHLQEAHKRYEFCARDRCPAIITKDCYEFLAKLEQDTPTLAIGARDRWGRDTLDVRIIVDGEPTADHLTGLAFPVDPGQHTLRFLDGQGNALEETIVARIGEKNRAILVDFSKPPAAEPLPPPRETAAAAPAERPPALASRPVPALAYVLGGTGILALGSFAVFGISALAKAHDLQSTCAPDCSSRTDDIHTMRLEGVVADVSLGASIVLLGTATALLFARRGSPHPTVAGYLAPTTHGETGSFALAF
jgi:hypothetical protein